MSSRLNTDQHTAQVAIASNHSHKWYQRELHAYVVILYVHYVKIFHIWFLNRRLLEDLIIARFWEFVEPIILSGNHIHSFRISCNLHGKESHFSRACLTKWSSPATISPAICLLRHFHHLVLNLIGPLLQECMMTENVLWKTCLRTVKSASNTTL